MVANAKNWVLTAKNFVLTAFKGTECLGKQTEYRIQTNETQSSREVSLLLDQEYESLNTLTN